MKVSELSCKAIGWKADYHNKLISTEVTSVAADCSMEEGYLKENSTP